MSVIDCDYLPPRANVEFPLLIVRKAGVLAAAFEEKVLDKLTIDARRALQTGVEPRVIARQMGLVSA